MVKKRERNILKYLVLGFMIISLFTRFEGITGKIIADLKEGQETIVVEDSSRKDVTNNVEVVKENNVENQKPIIETTKEYLDDPEIVQELGDKEIDMDEKYTMFDTFDVENEKLEVTENNIEENVDSREDSEDKDEDSEDGKGKDKDEEGDDDSDEDSEDGKGKDKDDEDSNEITGSVVSNLSFGFLDFSVFLVFLSLILILFFIGKI